MSTSPPPRPTRSEPREVLELRAIKARHPELADAVDLHLELVEQHRRILPRVPLPSIDLSDATMTRHQAEGRPLLRFEGIPIELTNLRLLVRQTSDVLYRFGTLDPPDHQRAQALARDGALLGAVEEWYRTAADRGPSAPGPGTNADARTLDAVFTLAMRPFLSRCAEVLQLRPELDGWRRAYCALCGGEPEMGVQTPDGERALVCGRCTLRWRFDAGTCPFCGNHQRGGFTSFTTPDQRFRMDACDVCRRYLKSLSRSVTRPPMPLVDGVAMLPLDAAAIQRGYSG